MIPLTGTCQKGNSKQEKKEKDNRKERKRKHKIETKKSNKRNKKLNKTKEHLQKQEGQVGALFKILEIPTPCLIDIMEFIQQAKQYTHSVAIGWLLVGLLELKVTEKRIVFIFVVDKQVNVIDKFTKNYLIKTLSSLG